jgi:hypothetical protein
MKNRHMTHHDIRMGFSKVDFSDEMADLLAHKTVTPVGG